MNDQDELDIASILLQLRKAQREEDENELDREEFSEDESDKELDFLENENLLPWQEMTLEHLPSYYLTEEEKEEIYRNNFLQKERERQKKYREENREKECERHKKYRKDHLDINEKRRNSRRLKKSLI